MSKRRMSTVGKCYNLPRTFFILKGAIPPSPTPLECYSVAAGMSEVLVLKYVHYVATITGKPQLCRTIV